MSCIYSRTRLKVNSAAVFTVRVGGGRVDSTESAASWKSKSWRRSFVFLLVGGQKFFVGTESE